MNKYTWSQFIKHFTSVIYSRKKVSLLLLTTLHVGMLATACGHAYYCMGAGMQLNVGIHATAREHAIQLYA